MMQAIWTRELTIIFMINSSAVYFLWLMISENAEITINNFLFVLLKLAAKSKNEKLEPVNFCHFCLKITKLIDDQK